MPQTNTIPKAVLRQQKVKTLGQLKARSNHNTRTQEGGLEHTDPTTGGADVFLGSADALDAWHKRMEAVGLDKSKLRSNAVVAVEWVASVSPQWFAAATPEMMQEWVETTTAFIAEKMGGKANILQAVLHTDESTPHLQFLTIPLAEKEVAARGRGSKDKPKRKVCSLSATDAVGGHRSRLEDFQTDYAGRVARLGIQRGTPRKETGARNINPATWRAQHAAKLDDAVAVHKEALTLRGKAAAVYKQAERAWTEAKAAASLLLGEAKAELAARRAKALARVSNAMPTAFQEPEAPQQAAQAVREPQQPPAPSQAPAPASRHRRRPEDER